MNLGIVGGGMERLCCGLCTWRWGHKQPFFEKESHLGRQATPFKVAGKLGEVLPAAFFPKVIHLLGSR